MEGSIRSPTEPEKSYDNSVAVRQNWVSKVMGKWLWVSVLTKRRRHMQVVVGGTPRSKTRISLLLGPCYETRHILAQGIVQ
jgi:hypothetical protein